MSSLNNLYAILDAIGLPALVGDGKLSLSDTIAFNNGSVVCDLNIKHVLKGIVEIEHSMWVVIRMEDLGVVYRATKGKVTTIIILNLRAKDCREYLKSNDILALLTACESKNKPKWVIDKLRC